MAEKKYNLYDTKGNHIATLDKSRMVELALQGEINWDGKSYLYNRITLKTDRTERYWKIRGAAISIGQLIILILLGYVSLVVFTLLLH